VHVCPNAGILRQQHQRQDAALFEQASFLREELLGIRRIGG